MGRAACDEFGSWKYTAAAATNTCTSQAVTQYKYRMVKLSEAYAADFFFLPTSIITHFTHMRTHTRTYTYIHIYDTHVHGKIDTIASNTLRKIEI